MGRQSTFTQEKADALCEMLADTDKSLRTICEELGLKPSTVVNWALNNEVFSKQYADARAIKLDMMAEEIHEIADTTQLGVKTKTNEKGEVETTESDMIEHRRLRIDARKWYLSKLAPKRYGEKIQAEHTGADGGPLQMLLGQLGKTSIPVVSDPDD